MEKVEEQTDLARAFVALDGDASFGAITAWMRRQRDKLRRTICTMEGGEEKVKLEGEQRFLERFFRRLETAHEALQQEQRRLAARQESRARTRDLSAQRYGTYV